jgi:PAS domain S-box-containing protein
VSSRPPRGAARLAAILDALPDALLLVNCNGTVVNANTIALETFETPGTALVGRGLLDLLPEFDSKRIPGSMRRPDEDEGGERTKPTRMIARRTDGSQFMVEVTSANLEDGRTAYGSSFEAAWADHNNHYTGDELLMLVVRDLAGTLDTEAELARQQRQTEMILRAASEGVVGVDTEGRIVLANPSAAQILGYRAGDLGGRALHPLVHHSKPDGSPLAYEETPLADTLRSGRKHRMRAGQVLWAKDGRAVPVDMTTAPVRDGEQLVGAVMTFADRTQQLATAARHEQLVAVLNDALRGPLEQLRGELRTLADDPAGQLWPEANQILHHLAAGYGRMTALVDNVLSYQQLDAGREKLQVRQVGMDSVVSAGVEAAVELIGPGRAQFAVHAPPIQAKVDPERLATALAHLIADVAGVDATGQTVAGASGDSTIVVAAAQRGDVVRIEVRGPHGGGSPVHEPVVRGIVKRHGGVLQTHEVPGSGTSAYVLEVPGALGTTAGAAAGSAKPELPAGSETAGGTTGAHDAGSTDGAQPAAGSGRRRRHASAQEATGPQAPERRALPALPAAAADTGEQTGPGTAASVPHQLPPSGADAPAEDRPGGGGRRARRALVTPPPTPQEETPAPQAQPRPLDGTVPGQPPAGTGRRRARAAAEPEPGEGLGGAGPTVPPQVAPGTGRRARRAPEETPPAAENGWPQPVNGATAPAQTQSSPFALPPGGGGAVNGAAVNGVQPQAEGEELPAVVGGGRRARRLAAARARAEAQAAGQSPSGSPFALPPAAADQPGPPGHPGPPGPPGRPSDAGALPAVPQEPAHEAQDAPPRPDDEQAPVSADLSRVAASPILGGGPLPERTPQQHRPALPSAAGHDTQTGEQHASGGISVRTLGQGVRFTPAHDARQPSAAPPGPGRRRRLTAPPEAVDRRNGAAPGTPQLPGRAREFAIGAPAAGAAEGPEPLDGPNGAVEVTDDPQMTMSLRAVDDELPPEPLDNPRRLLVWPEPDVSTQQALSARGYRPVIVHSREEVDAQIAAYPAALFVDPLTGPITRKALQSLRQAAVAAEVPVLVTAGLGQAARDAAYGADPAVLLKALAPRDGDEQPPRVLLIEERQPVAVALAATLERRGLQVVHAPSDADAVHTAERFPPNLVVMDLMQVRRRRAGIIDWLRVNGLLNRTPFVVYTSADMDAVALQQLQSGQSVLFLAERSTSAEVQTRIVDLLTKIGAN